MNSDVFPYLTEDLYLFSFIHGWAWIFTIVIIIPWSVCFFSVSCMSSSFVRGLEWMFLTHSILYGIGSSLIYMASSLVIGEYFDKDHKYHVLATSILLCGYPIGE